MALTELPNTPNPAPKTENSEVKRASVPSVKANAPKPVQTGEGLPPGYLKWPDNPATYKKSIACNWHLQSVGEEIFGENNTTGETFRGTMKEFNAILRG